MSLSLNNSESEFRTLNRATFRIVLSALNSPFDKALLDEWAHRRRRIRSYNKFPFPTRFRQGMAEIFLLKDSILLEPAFQLDDDICSLRKKAFFFENARSSEEEKFTVKSRLGP